MMGMSKSLYPSDSFEFAQRKKDHIELTHQSRTSASTVDQRFNYEPLFFKHPSRDDLWPVKFLGKMFHYPIWVSSMTGGIDSGKRINENLARLCGEFKLGMGLGSCRTLLESTERFADFSVRRYMGDQPLLANIGIAQLAELIISNKIERLHEMVKSLEADGLVIHLNPLQEWFQKGGDKYLLSPLAALQSFLQNVSYPIFIKEVGHGIGPKSLKALLELPIAGIEFGAYGGTNFSKLEDLRSQDSSNHKQPFIHVGHTAYEMVEILNALPSRNKEFIISGGMNSILDGYELIMKLKSPGLIGMASNFLGPAQTSYQALQEHFIQMQEALLVAKGILDLKDKA
jgi:isopentenyl-diphosphate delta-isomerase